MMYEECEVYFIFLLKFNIICYQPRRVARRVARRYSISINE